MLRCKQKVKVKVFIFVDEGAYFRECVPEKLQFYVNLDKKTINARFDFNEQSKMQGRKLETEIEDCAHEIIILTFFRDNQRQ